MENQQNELNMFASNTLFSPKEDNEQINIEKPKEFSQIKNKSTWINDIDSSLILENIDNTAENKVVKIKLKLTTLEKTLFKVSEELKVLQLFNLDKDKEKREQLIILKNNIENKIQQLKEEKNKYGAFYLISAYTNNKITYDTFAFIFDKFFILYRRYYKLLLRRVKSNKKFYNILKMVRR